MMEKHKYFCLDEVHDMLIRFGYVGKNILYLKNRYLSSKDFAYVSLESTNYCNRSCHYCPVSVSRKSKHSMPFELFIKIIDELADHNYMGEVLFGGYGEPLSDDRIVDFIKYSRSKLPGNFLQIYSNGDYLTLDLFYKLIDAGLSHIRISEHAPILDGKKIRHDKISYVQYYDNSIKLMNRAGNINIKKEYLWKSRGFCHVMAQRSLNIDSYGNIILCCNDYKSERLYGNVETSSIYDIWFNSDFTKIRDKVQSGFLDDDFCKRCSLGFINMDDLI